MAKERDKRGWYDPPESRKRRQAAYYQRKKAKEQARMERLSALLAPLSEKDASAFMVSPMFIGGDSVDLETWLVEVYDGEPVTSATVRQVVQQFREWYRETAPEEYHEPTKPIWM